MGRPRTHPQEPVHNSSVKYTAATASMLASISARLGRQSWRSILAGLADGTLVAVKQCDLPPAPNGDIHDSYTLRASQYKALLAICRQHRIDYRGLPSLSMLLYAIAVGAILVEPASPSADG